MMLFRARVEGVAICAAMATAVAACSVSFKSAGDYGTPASAQAGADEEDAAASFEARATGTADAASAPFYEGSPLCNYARTSADCLPDTPATLRMCGTDAGLDGDGSAPTAFACHISAPGPSESREQVCTIAGSGRDGDSCLGSLDCAAGFECTANGECRHYCCNPKSCDGISNSFCDVQSMTTARAFPVKVPVCMPARRCSLLQSGTCAVDETCAVVREAEGTTACVKVGRRDAGEECDTDHCAAGLTCLGTVGYRRCYELCRIEEGSDCDPSKKCVGGAPRFTDPAIGICL